MLKYKHIRLEQHPEGTLIKRVKTGETVAGITRSGEILVLDGCLLTDEELLEIFKVEYVDDFSNDAQPDPPP